MLSIQKKFIVIVVLWGFSSFIWGSLHPPPQCSVALILFIIVYYTQRSRPLFPNFQIWSNAAYIHSLITFALIQSSIHRTKPSNTIAWITLTMHACTNFFKILQGSSNSWTNMCYIIKMQRVQGYQIWHSLVSWRSWRPWRSWRSWTGHISFEDILHFRIYYIYIYIYIYIKIFMYIYNFNVNVNDLLNTIFYFSKSQFLNSTYLWT